MKPIYILNGPNLNLLGKREPEIYGHETLQDVEKLCRDQATALKLTIDFRQTNSEGDLLGHIHEAREKASGIIINAGAYTHSSIALHDGLRMVDVPAIEVHLSNIYKREEFRHHSYLSAVVQGVICGFGPHSYELAIIAMAKILNTKRKAT